MPKFVRLTRLILPGCVAIAAAALGASLFLQDAAATASAKDDAKLRASHGSACALLGHSGAAAEACVEELLRVHRSPIEVFVRGADGGGTE